MSLNSTTSATFSSSSPTLFIGKAEKRTTYSDIPNAILAKCIGFHGNPKSIKTVNKMSYAASSSAHFEIMTRYLKNPRLARVVKGHIPTDAEGALSNAHCATTVKNTQAEVIERARMVGIPVFAKETQPIEALFKEVEKKEVRNFFSFAEKVCQKIPVSQRPSEDEICGNTLQESADLLRQWMKNHPDILNAITELDLSSCHLTAMPSEIGLLRNLRVLNASRNEICDLPREIENLTDLEEIDLSHNAFKFFPERVCSLGNLKQLDLSYNDFNRIANAIGRLNQLRKLDLSHNKIFAQPPQIGLLGQLEELDLSYNRIKHLSEQISGLERLERLYLNNNAIETIPSWLGEFKVLHALNLSNNPIHTLPETLGQLNQLGNLYMSSIHLTHVPKWIEQLTSLEILDLSHNALRILPDTMRHLTRMTWMDLSHNQLRAVPGWVGEFDKLQRLDLQSNLLKALPTKFAQLAGNLLTLRLKNNLFTARPALLDFFTELDPVDFSGNLIPA
ncbi:MAG TPA: leucine-rich repeat domain-containing protein [Rhabdochlamydiaceae bacterium]|jgi:Leucine-rich repeat (LRR) protein